MGGGGGGELIRNMACQVRGEGSGRAAASGCEGVVPSDPASPHPLSLMHQPRPSAYLQSPYLLQRHNMQ